MSIYHTGRKRSEYIQPTSLDDCSAKMNDILELRRAAEHENIRSGGEDKAKLLAIIRSCDATYKQYKQWKSIESRKLYRDCDKVLIKLLRKEVGEELFLKKCQEAHEIYEKHKNLVRTPQLKQQ